VEVLRVENLNKEFGGIQAARNISFEIAEGEHLAIIGPNGAGKTTLFNLLTGQLTPSSGRIFFYGRDITRTPAYQRTHLGMARSFQITSLFLNLTVMENAMLSLNAVQPSCYQVFRPVASYKSLYAKAEELLASMDLWLRRDEAVHSISYGEQRKLEIAMSLASNPRLLLLDEPSCGLTTTESSDITSRIRNLGSNITVLLVAHDMDLVYGVAHRIIVLHYGETIMQGTCDEIRCSEKVKEIYMGSEEDI
jgi:branched-chain amino acid transport system ATP-binding protein